MIETVPTSDIAKLSSDHKFQLADKVSNRVIYVHLNQWNDKTVPFVTDKDGKPLDKNPFKDARVRQALSMAINRQAIADRVMERGAARRAAAAGLLLRHEPEAEAAQVRPRRREEAARRGGLSERLHASRSTAPNNRYINDDQVAQAIAQFYSRIGIDAKVEAMPLARLLHARDQASSASCCSAGARIGRADLALRSLLATHDPTRAWAWPTGPLLQPGASTSMIDALVTMDDKKREAMIQQAAETAMNDTALIPLHYQVSTWATARAQVHRADRRVHVRHAT